jgi:segregation and condensation protein A
MLAMTMPDEPYQVRLAIFEGPLDLLLHLIERHQMEITAISLVAVADQFVDYLAQWRDPPLAHLADFVAMASRLIFIKSRSLLPRNSRPEDDIEIAEAEADAEALRRNLLEYKLAREIAQTLRERDAAGLHSFARPTPPQGAIDQVGWVPPQLVGVDAQVLASAFRRVLAELRERETESLPLPVVTVAEKIAEIEARLAEHASITLDDLIAGETRRIAIVVTFIAMLELWHLHRIAVRQDDLFGAIVISRDASNS